MELVIRRALHRLVIDSLNILHCWEPCTWSVAGVAEYMWCSTSKIAFSSKIYINSKIKELKNSIFPDKGWIVNGWKYLLKKLRDSGTTARQPGSGRRESDLPLVLQGRVGAHKSGVAGNTIYVLLQISSSMLLPKNMKNGSRIKSYLQIKKGTVFWNTV